MFKLRTNSNQDHSTTYNLAKPFFSWGSAEELFLFNKNGLCMCQGQNNTDGPGQHTLVHHLLQGNALAASNHAALACGNETLPNYHAAMQDLIMHMLPQCTLQMQCWLMRHKLCKTPDMSIQDFMTQLIKMNQYLNEFPLFMADQALPKDEILDIAKFGVPNSWQKTFDPTVHTIKEFIEFCKRLKFMEGFNPNDKPNKNSTQEMSSHMDTSVHSTGALMQPTKSSAHGNKNKKHKHSQD